VNSTIGPATVVDVEPMDDSADGVAAFLTADPELDWRLPEIEARVLRHFGPGTKLKRTVFHPMDEEDAEDAFILRVDTDHAFDEKVGRLRAFIRAEDEFIAPVRRRLTIGIL